jgi:ubiquinol-cytochrome c reductase cytochrome c subunit
MRVLRLRRVVVLGVAALAAAVCMGAGAASAASAEKGKAAFIKNGCWQCHGFEGQGGVAGKTLAPDPLPIEAFVAFVRTTNRAMPPYSETVLPDADLTDIHAYLSSVPQAPDPKSIPLLTVR